MKIKFGACFLFILLSAYNVYADGPGQAGAYSTAVPKPVENQAEKKNVPYTEFTSLKPVFAEEPLDENDYLELSREDVDKVYAEFKKTILIPPYPKALANSADYRIDDAQGAFDRCAELTRNINKLIFSVTDESLKKYGPLLQAMRDVVYLDAVCLKEYLNGNEAHRDMWHDLHNKWASAAEERYAAL